MVKRCKTECPKNVLKYKYKFKYPEKNGKYLILVTEWNSIFRSISIQYYFHRSCFIMSSCDLICLLLPATVLLVLIITDFFKQCKELIKYTQIRTKGWILVMEICFLQDLIKVGWHYICLVTNAKARKKVIS